MSLDGIALRTHRQMDEGRGVWASKIVLVQMHEREQRKKSVRKQTNDKQCETMRGGKQRCMNKTRGECMHSRVTVRLLHH